MTNTKRQYQSRRPNDDFPKVGVGGREKGGVGGEGGKGKGWSEGEPSL